MRAHIDMNYSPFPCASQLVAPVHPCPLFSKHRSGLRRNSHQVQGAAPTNRVPHPVLTVKLRVLPPLSGAPPDVSLYCYSLYTPAITALILKHSGLLILQCLPDLHHRQPDVHLLPPQTHTHKHTHTHTHTHTQRQ